MVRTSFGSKKASPPLPPHVPIYTLTLSWLPHSVKCCHALPHGVMCCHMVSCAVTWCHVLSHGVMVTCSYALSYIISSTSDPVPSHAGTLHHFLVDRVCLRSSPTMDPLLLPSLPHCSVFKLLQECLHQAKGHQ